MQRCTTLVSASAALALCVAASAPAQQPGPLSPDTAALAKGNNAFAFNLYGKLQSTEGNLFFSPYSISNALAMTYAGARGKTANDMAATLQFPFKEDRLHAAFADLIREIDRAGKERKYKLAIANRLWGQKDYGFLPDFLKLSKDAYGAGLEELDFITAPEAARGTINDWVAKETLDKIKDLLPTLSIDEDTRFVLTNAIYFKGDWDVPFNVKATKKEDFKLGSAKTAKTDMMQIVANLSLTENDVLQLLVLPYQKNELSMLVLLPRKGDGLAKMESQLTVNNLQRWLGEMKPHVVTVGLPKFKFTTSSIDLGSTLSKMGMDIAFSEKEADFSGMASRKKLHISSVIHKGFVEVDEKGTEAAAATAVVGKIPVSDQGPLPFATFRADHPFVFFIRDNRTGSILFMGRVMNPQS